MKGVPHYTKDGKEYKGKTHKMKDGSLHTGKTHTTCLLYTSPSPRD